MTLENRSKRHSIDVFFVLCLFMMFALCLSALLLAGAKSYQRISQNSQDNFDLRTSLFYVTNKMRSADSGGISLGEFGTGDAIFLEEEVDGVLYVTKIYQYEDCLMELFAEQGNDLDPVAGVEVTKVSDFQVEKIEGELLEVSVVSPKGKKNSMVTMIH